MKRGSQSKSTDGPKSGWRQRSVVGVIFVIVVGVVVVMVVVVVVQSGVV